MKTGFWNKAFGVYKVDDKLENNKDVLVSELSYTNSRLVALSTFISRICFFGLLSIIGFAIDFFFRKGDLIKEIQILIKNMINTDLGIFLCGIFVVFFVVFGIIQFIENRKLKKYKKELQEKLNSLDKEENKIEKLTNQNITNIAINCETKEEDKIKS